MPLAIAKGAARFIAIKTSVRLCPWADVLYACDMLWWQDNAGAMDFTGLKVTINRRASEAGWNVKLLRCGFSHAMEFDDVGRVGWGLNSGFGAVNFAAQLSPAKIVLVGFDMTFANGTRWHGSHPGPHRDPSPRIIERWRCSLDNAAMPLAARGIRVIDCSLQGALQNFDKLPFEDAIRV